MYEWQPHRPGQPKYKGPGLPLATRPGDKRAVLAAACTAEDVWVTVGVKHIKFWRVHRRTVPATKTSKERDECSLEFVKGSWGLLEGSPTTLVTVASVSGGLTLAGADTGSIFMFQGTVLAAVVRDPGGHSPGVDGAPLMPMFDMTASHLTGLAQDDRPVIATGGRDGKARFWAVQTGEEEEGGGAKAERGRGGGLELLAELDVHDAASKAMNKAGLITSFSGVRPDLPAGLRSVSSVERVSPKGEKERFVLCGLSTDELVLLRVGLSPGRKLEVERSPSASRILSQSHFTGRVTDVAPHPSGHLFATCGEDRSVRVWSSQEKQALALGMVPAAARCLCWSPKESIDHHIAVGLASGIVAVMIYKVGKHEMGITPLPLVPARHEGYSITCLQYAPDAKYLAVGISCGHVDVYDVSQAYNRVGMCVCKQLEGEAQALRSITWSSDCKTLMTESAAYGLAYWDLLDAANMDCQRIENAERMSKETWATWTSIAGWPTAGVHSGAAASAHVTSVDCKADYGGIGQLKIIPGDKDGCNICAVGDSDGSIRLVRFPALVGCRDHREGPQQGTQITGHGTEAAKVRFSADGRRLFVACGANLAVMQYRVMHPSEVGQSGKMLKANLAASAVVTKLDQEMFWKVSVAEIEEMRRRGMPSDAVRSS